MVGSSMWRSSKIQKGLLLNGPDITPDGYDTLNARQDIDELPETYVIFISRYDVLGYGLPIYHIRRKIEEVGTDFKDEAYIIYVNSSRRDDTELGHLMKDFYCTNADDIHSEVLARRVYELKETQEEIDSMCREMDEIVMKVRNSVKSMVGSRGLQKGLAAGEMKKVFSV